MKVRITFRSDLVLEGKTLQEVKDKWGELPLFSGEALEEGSAEFLEIDTVEEAETNHDLRNEWYKLI